MKGGIITTMADIHRVENNTDNTKSLKDTPSEKFPLLDSKLVKAILPLARRYFPRHDCINFAERSDHFSDQLPRSLQAERENKLPTISHYGVDLWTYISIPEGKQGKCEIMKIPSPHHIFMACYRYSPDPEQLEKYLASQEWGYSLRYVTG